MSKKKTKRPTSPRQVAANADNAKRSTGPKTPAGKIKSSGNAVTHGLRAVRIWLLPDETGRVFDDLKELFEELKPSGRLEKELLRRMAQAQVAIERIDRMEAEVLQSGTPAQRSGELNDILFSIKSTNDASAGIVAGLAKACGVDGAEVLRSMLSSPIGAKERTAPTGACQDTNGGGIGKAEKAADPPPATTVASTPSGVHGDSAAAPDAAARKRSGLPGPFELLAAQDSASEADEALIENFAGNASLLDRLQRYRTAHANAYDRAFHELQRLQAARMGRQVAAPCAIDVNVAVDGPVQATPPVEEK